MSEYPAWQEDAACLGYPQHMFFTDDRSMVQRAKQICATCPVRIECLAYATANKEEVGVWGGVHFSRANKERERRHRIRDRRRQEGGAA